MITLKRIPLTSDHTRKVIDKEKLERLAVEAYTKDVAPTVYGHHYGFITVEPTPGTFNNNPRSRMAKIVHHINDTSTRNGFYVKLQVMPNGDLRSV